MFFVNESFLILYPRKINELPTATEKTDMIECNLQKIR